MSEIVTFVIIAIASFFLIYAYMRRKIDKSALSGSAIVGAVVLLTVGCAGVVALLLFFILGNIVTKYKYEKKERLGVAESHKGMRTLHNVIGNGLSPVMFGLAYALSCNPLFIIGFSGAVATACADTFSTEIGQALGKPRLITNLKRVPVGTNGGVSLPGLLAAMLGSSLIAIPFSFLLSCSACNAHSLLHLFIHDTPASPAMPITSTTTQTPFHSLAFPLAFPSALSLQSCCGQYAIIIALSGFLGSIADSIFGATIEDRPPLRLNKHCVNVLATLSGGIFAMSLRSLCSL